MSYCQVTADINRYYNEMDELDKLEEWVEKGRISTKKCPECNLFFSTFNRAPSVKCGRCLEPSKYPWVDGKRAKWTDGPIMDLSRARV